MYEIQTFTLCDGYVNTWLDENENPIVFATKEEALAELHSYLTELRESVEQGLLSDYSVDDFRISNI